MDETGPDLELGPSAVSGSVQPSMLNRWSLQYAIARLASLRRLVFSKLPKDLALLTQDHMNDLPWPLMVLDFEASGLSANSYPIEVGLCLWRSPANPLEGWSTLIRPTDDWLRDGEWSAASQTIHGIDRGELDGGLTPTDIVATLDGLLDAAEDRTVWVDGGPFDLHWARRLAMASSVPLRMKIGDFDALAGRLSSDGYRDLVEFMGRSPIPHRARADAERMLQAIARGLGFGEVERRDLII